MERAAKKEYNPPPISDALNDPCAFYEYYRNLKPNTTAAKFMHLGSLLLYWPRVHYAPPEFDPETGEKIAEGAKEALEANARRGVRNMIASNHSRLDDQQSLASMMRERRNKAFHGFIGNAIILAKIGHFKRRRIRRIIESWGAIPIIRPEDMPDNVPRAQKQLITQELQDTIVQRVTGGEHAVGFWEGTRQKINQHKLGQVKKGMARSAREIAKKTKLAVTPIALYWGDSDNKRWLRRWFTPDIYVMPPVPVDPEAQPSEIIQPVRAGMASALERAVAASRKRRPTLRLAFHRIINGRLPNEPPVDE